jgi:flagellar biogenesis protein FliO
LDFGHEVIMDSFGFILRAISALALVALLLVALIYIVRTLSRGRLVVASSRRLVSVVESTFLAQHVTVHVIKVADRYFLVGGGSAGVSKIEEIPAESVTPWLDEQKRVLAGQRDAVMNVLGRFQKR